MSEDRDILIEVRSDLKHVRETMDKLTASDGKQWEKIDEHGAALAGHEKSVGFLLKGFWALVTAGTGAVVAYLFDKK